MKTKKIQSILIAAIMLLSVATILAPSINADEPSSVKTIRGYVYIDGAITEVDDVILSISGGEFYAYKTYTDGYYEIWDEMTEGDTGTFTVSYMGSLYIAAETVTITGDYLYKINLTVDTSASNSPPNTPSNPSPTGSDVNIESDLSWTCSDPNGDSLTYDVYFGTDSNPPLFDSDQTETTYALSTLAYSTTYYWQIVADDNNGGTTAGPVWSFTTEAETPAEYCGDGICNNGEDCSSCSIDCGECSSPPSGGGGGGNPAPPSGPTLSSPTADAGGPYNVGNFVDEEITFDGSASSDSDGTIESYEWDFDNDGEFDERTGENPTYSWTIAGTYTIKLKVTDNDGLTNVDETTVTVDKPNTPPYNLTIIATEEGSVDVAHDFTATAEDDDSGDKIEYGWDWDKDGTVDEWSSENYSSGEISAINHTFTVAGMYTIKAQALDQTGADVWSDELMIFIDTAYVDLEEPNGKLLDKGKDGTYDTYYNSSSEEETNLGIDDDGNYLIDDNGDDEWDYVYDPNTGGVSKYEEPSNQGDTSSPEKSNNTIWYVLIIIVILLLLLFLAFGGKKKAEPKKKNNQNKKKGNKK